MKAKNIKGIFTGYRGQKIFNYLYSIGASIVILGAMFKLLHVPFADPILIIGMGTEAIIFFLSAFDEPAQDYKWERVFSALENEEATGSELPEVVAGAGTNGGVQLSGTIVVGGGSGAPAEGTTVVGSGYADTEQPVIIGGGGPTVIGGTSAPAVISGGYAPTDMADIPTSAASAATEDYVNKLTEINESLAKLQASLSQNIQGLNAMYELQLRDVGSQLQSVSRVHNETEQMAKTIAELNAIYEKMLAAMQNK